MYSPFQFLIASVSITIPYFLWPSSHDTNNLQHGLPQETLDWIEKIRQKYDLPGISIGVIASPEYTGSNWKNVTYGFGSMDRYGRPIDEQTLFSIASNTKLFASIAIGLLVENDTVLDNGELFDYSTVIKDIIPTWDLQDAYAAEHVDVLDLLTMRSGLPRHDVSYAEEDENVIIRRLAHLRPSAGIRQVMQYNNMHYWVIGEIVARLSKIPFHEYVKTHILDPVGMVSTTFNHTFAAETGNRSEPFVNSNINSSKCVEIWERDDELDKSCYGDSFSTAWHVKGDGLFMAAVGGLFSSTSDIMIWLRELLDPKILPKRVIDKTHDAVIPSTGQTAEFDEEGTLCYGLAQQTLNYRGHKVIMHEGSWPGFTTQITRLPGVGIGIFLAINNNNIGWELRTPIVYRINDAVLGLEPIDWEERLVTKSLRTPKAYTPIPDHPRPAPSLANLTGGYFDSGYGSLDILPFKDPDTSRMTFLNEYAKPTTRFQYLSAIDKVISTQPGFTEPLLFSHTGKMLDWIYVFSHFDGPLLNVSIMNVRQSPDGELHGYSGPTSTAVFVEGRGVGMFENHWWGKSGKRAVEQDVENHAEVWFDKERD